MGSSESEPLDLRSAAAELGVHYQTAYGWVRNGRLPAELVRGRYVVMAGDLRAAQRGRATPASPRRPSTQRLARSSTRMQQALLVGDEPTAQRIALGLLSEGTSAVELIQHVLVPPLLSIGQLWRDGVLTIPVEHRAAAIVERVLGQLTPNPRGRRRGRALVAAISGDAHSLPTSMAAAALREDHWHVEHLGAGMPPGDLVRFCAERSVDLAVITSTNPETADVASDTAAALRAAGTPTIVGGPGRTLDELVELARHAR